MTDNILEPPPPFQLSAGERSTPLWQRIQFELRAKLADLREQNDSQLDPLQTANLRGQIQTLKSILDLGSEPPVLGDDG